MEKIPSALQSPRNVCGVLHWYAGDTFLLELSIALRDNSGVIMPFAESDTVTIIFYNQSGDTVHTFIFSNIQDNTVQLDFSGTITAKFTHGPYTYDAVYDGKYRRTIAKGNKAVVD